jgi:spore maturation protein CgeB
MKILIVGFDTPWAIEKYYIKYLQAYGAEVILYPAAGIVYNYHTKNIVNKILFKSKIKTRYPAVNKELLEKAQAIKPDIIWVFKGMEIYPQTLQELTSKGFKLANYNPDHPFIITSSGSGNKNVTDSVGLYDLHFCYQHQLQREIEQRFGIATAFLPFAYDDDDVSYIEPGGITEVNRVCFQGNPDDYRANIINMLADAGIPVDVYGHKWNKTAVAGKKDVRIFPIASRKEFWKMNQEYRLQLNLFREYNFGSHNMRTFEVPVVGGIELAPYSEEQAEFFEEGKEIFFFRDVAEIIQRVRDILSLPQETIQHVRGNARMRSLTSGYSFADRAKTVLRTFQELR